MYWMLLPLDANAPRHVEYGPLPPGGSWKYMFLDCWRILLKLPATKHT
jgi:hypothetical protein